MRKLHSPSPFGVGNRKASRRKRVYTSLGGGLQSCFRMGRFSCFIVIFLMLGAAAIIAVSAEDRTVGAAWGNLADSAAGGEFVLPSSGFIVVEMSDVFLDEEGEEAGFDVAFLRSAVGRKGEPNLLPVGATRAARKEERGEADEVCTEAVLPAPECAPLPMTDFSWSISDNFGVTAPRVSVLQPESPGFPEHLVERGAQFGGTGLSTGFGVSRMTVFQPKTARGLTLGDSSFSTVNGALFANSGVSCLPSFKEVACASASDSSASDYEAVILTAGEDGGRPLAAEGDDADDGDVLLAKVDVIWKEHYVKSGETLSDIATAHGVPMSDIVKANELKNANRLSEKQLLLIPNDSSAVESTLEEVLTRKARLVAVREKVLPIKITAYVVADGDSLWSISNSQSLEIDTLIGCNDLANINKIRPGVTLRVPNQDGVFYKVKKDDTLAAIAKRYAITADRIREANGDAVSTLVAGKEIFLPGARPERPEAPARAAGTAAPQKGEAVKATGGTRNFKWPVVGKINSPFGWRRHPVTRRRDFHTGIDIKASRGNPIHASRAGVVDYSGWMGGYGKVVVINHGDGNSTLYAHCSTLSVSKGQRISQGQVVAKVGTTGRATGPHLHFEIRKGNNPVNPLGYLK